MFSVKHQNQTLQCDSKQYQPNSAFASVDPTTGVVSCKEEDKSSIVPDSTCAIQYNTEECVELKVSYKRQQTYYLDVLTILSISVNSSVVQTSEDAWYEYKTLEMLVQKCKALLTHNTGTLYKSLDRERKNMFWISCINAMYNLHRESTLRDNYKQLCMCISDSDHDNRSVIVGKLFARVQEIFIHVFREAIRFYSFPKLTSNTYPLQDIDLTLDSAEVLCLYKILQNANGFSKINKTLGDLLHIYSKGILEVEVDKFLSLHTISFPLSQKNLTTLQTKLANIFVHLKDFVLEAMKEGIYKSLHIIFHDTHSYFDKGIECIELDQKLRPTNVHINADKLRKFLLNYHHIDISETELENYMQDDVVNNAYTLCLQNYFSNKLNELLDLCERVRKDNKLDHKVAQVLFQMCTDRDPSKSLTYYLYNNKSGISLAWTQFKNTVISEGKKATGDLVVDLPFMTIENKISLLQAYFKDTRITQDSSSESDSEEDEAPYKKHKGANFIMRR